MFGVVRKFYLGGICSVFLVTLYFLLSCSRDSVGTEKFDVPFPGYNILELELLDLINDYRVSAGYNNLQRLEEISDQARFHSNHMSLAKEICHHNFGSRYRALTQKVGAKAMGENVGYGYRTSEAFLMAWLNSPNHRKIIEGKSTHFGISAKEAEGQIYVTLIFIRK